MTVLEIMERTGVKETNLVIAWLKDAFHQINSTQPEHVKVHKQNIIDGEREYPLPSDAITIKSVSVYDTTDSKYKKIRRLSPSTTLTEDTDPS